MCNQIYSHFIKSKNAKIIFSLLKDCDSSFEVNILVIVIIDF